MKTLYKLKGARPTPLYNLELSNKEAELVYHDGAYYDIDLCKRIPSRYSDPTILTFEQWLIVHKVRIL